jgi:hypothetical protein
MSVPKTPSHKPTPTLPNAASKLNALPSDVGELTTPVPTSPGWQPQGELPSDPVGWLRGLEPRRQVALLGNQSPIHQAAVLQGWNSLEQVAYLETLSERKRRAVVAAMVRCVSVPSPQAPKPKDRAQKLAPRLGKKYAEKALDALVIEAYRQLANAAWDRAGLPKVTRWIRPVSSTANK